MNTNLEYRELWVIKSPDLGDELPSSSAELKLLPLGTEEDVRKALARLGDTTWLDPWAGLVDGDGWTLEISLSVGLPIQELTLRIHDRGQPPEMALDLIRVVCRENEWRAIDLDDWAILT